MNLSIQVLIALQRSCDQVPDTRQEIDAHARVKTVRIGAADGEEADFALVAKRHERHRTDFVGVVVKQEVALGVAHLAASRPLTVEKRVERAERFVLAFYGAEKPARFRTSPGTPHRRDFAQPMAG